MRCENAAFSYSDTNNYSLHAEFHLFIPESREKGDGGERVRKRQCGMFSNILCIIAMKIKEEKLKQKNSLKFMNLPS